ncbi:MAG: hypothetical protein AAF386_08460, partial [Pseudomonadota bacterium]
MMISAFFKYAPKWVAILLLPLGVAACGGATTSATPTPTPPVTPVPSAQGYVALNDTAATQTSALAGDLIVTNGNNGTQWITSNTGSLHHTTADMALVHGGYSFTPLPGTFSTTSAMSDGQGGTLQPVPGFAPGYTYLLVYNGSYINGGRPFDTFGVMGIATLDADMPTVGTALYTGSAALTVHTQNGLSEIYSNGTTTLTASFGDGTALAILDGFTVT